MVGSLTPVIHARAGRTRLRRRALLAGEARDRIDDLVRDVFVELFRDEGKALRAWDPGRGLSLAYWIGLIAEQSASAALRIPRDLVATEPIKDALEERDNDDPEATALARDKPERLLEATLIVEQEPRLHLRAHTGISTAAVQAWSSRLKRRIAELMGEFRADRYGIAFTSTSSVSGSSTTSP
jgi:RNA polymerase sigma-70 factor (ECF subfamily)